MGHPPDPLHSHLLSFLIINGSSPQRWPSPTTGELRRCGPRGGGRIAGLRVLRGFGGAGCAHDAALTCYAPRERADSGSLVLAKLVGRVAVGFSEHLRSGSPCDLKYGDVIADIVTMLRRGYPPCSVSDADGSRPGRSRWAVPGFAVTKCLRFTTYLRLTSLAEFEQARKECIRAIKGLGAELQTKRAPVSSPGRMPLNRAVRPTLSRGAGKHEIRACRGIRGCASFHSGKSTRAHGLRGLPPEKVLATVVHLLESTLIRVGMTTTRAEQQLWSDDPEEPPRRCRRKRGSRTVGFDRRDEVPIVRVG
jgi:hypothetical protein